MALVGAVIGVVATVAARVVVMVLVVVAVIVVVPGFFDSSKIVCAHLCLGRAWCMPSCRHQVVDALIAKLESPCCLPSRSALFGKLSQFVLKVATSPIAMLMVLVAISAAVLSVVVAVVVLKVGVLIVMVLSCAMVHIRKAAATTSGSRIRVRKFLRSLVNLALFAFDSEFTAGLCGRNVVCLCAW